MDGSLGFLVPLDERMYRRLLLLQQVMAMIVPMALFLNHKDFRLFKSRRFRMFKKRGVLDGCLLWQYLSLHPQLQEELASIVGVTSYTIKENLHEIDLLTGFI
jgi:cleavage and polyadenylation specificity factor subunit 1